MQKIGKILAVVLGMLLFWNGWLSVFMAEVSAADIFRFWKEILLGLLLLVTPLMREQKASFGEKIKGYIQHLFGKKRQGRENFWQRPIFWAALFLLWLGMTAGVEQNYYSSLAARYIGMGFFTFIVFAFFLRKWGKKAPNFFQKFSTAIVWSAVFSVLFGIWAKFGGGFELLSGTYSPTISSWVPGQLVPIYHQVGDFVRMQGGASGPVEFGHLLFVALFLGFANVDLRMTKAFKFGALPLLLFGVLQSGSRAAMGGSVILLLFWLFQQIPRKKVVKSSDRVLKYTRVLFWVVIIIALAKASIVTFLPEEERQKTMDYGLSTIDLPLARFSDSDHLNRPVQAFKDGLANPLFGQLGSYGPAARARNLAEKNDDQAPIAENIFADYFVQLGGIGLFLALAFWYHLFRWVSRRDQIFVFTAFILVNLATLFDMTPISILFFAVFAILANKEVRAKR